MRLPNEIMRMILKINTNSHEIFWGRRKYELQNNLKHLYRRAFNLAPNYGQPDYWIRGKVGNTFIHYDIVKKRITSTVFINGGQSNILTCTNFLRSKLLRVKSRKTVGWSNGKILYRYLDIC
jgi:hypothetical protein